MNIYTKTFAFIIPICIGVIFYPRIAQANIQDWQKGVNIVPPYSNNTTDFGTETFRQSLRNLSATKANYVSLVVPYYQANIYSSDIYRGYNTPTDESLISAIEYAHSLNLKVMIKLFLDPQDGQWRAFINPTNKTEWFQDYEALLIKYGTLSQTYGVEGLTIGTELISTTNPNIDPQNTQNWTNMIAKTRQVYKGPLTYGSQWGEPFDEKNLIEFWPQLDYIGISAYFPLSQESNPSVDTLKNKWHYWNTTQIRPLYEKYNIPIIFTELGYKNMDGAFIDPGSWQNINSSNETAQANGYEAVLSYFNDYNYIKGIHFWDWKSDPNAGGSQNIDYTPQNKLAQQVMTNWFSLGRSLTPATYNSSASTTSNPVIVNKPMNITATVTNSSPDSDGEKGIIDIEIYNSQNQKVYQKFFEQQQILSGSTQRYEIQWTPPNKEAYTVKIGVFNANWSKNYSWNGQALVFTPQDITPVSQPIIPTPIVPTSPPVNPTPTPVIPITIPPIIEPEVPTQNSSQIDIWWPSNGSSVSGLQPFQVLVDNLSVDKYKMYWQVDGGVLNLMQDNFNNYPHKESLVDLSGWKWQNSGKYLINFVAKDLNGAMITQKSTVITVW